MLDRVLGPENMTVNRIEKFSAFLNGCIFKWGIEQINMKQMQGVTSVTKKNCADKRIENATGREL